MRTLEEILISEDRVNEIINFSDFYGFKNVKIFNEHNNGVLILVVSADGVIYPAAFEAAISKALDCLVSVIVEQNVKVLYKNYISENSVPISDFTGIQKLFDMPLSQIKYRSFQEDTDYQFQKQSELNLADKILFSKNKSYSDFFKTSKPLQKEEHTSPEDFEKIGEKVFSDVFQSKENIQIQDIGKFLSGFIKAAVQNGYDAQSIMDSMPKSTNQNPQK